MKQIQKYIIYCILFVIIQFVINWITLFASLYIANKYFTHTANAPYLVLLIFPLLAGLLTFLLSKLSRVPYALLIGILTTLAWLLYMYYFYFYSGPMI